MRTKSAAAGRASLTYQRDRLRSEGRGDDADKWLAEHDPARTQIRKERRRRQRAAGRRMTTGASAAIEAASVTEAGAASSGTRAGGPSRTPTPIRATCSGGLA